MDLVYKNGVRCELQVRDDKVNDWSEAEHVIHDFDDGKVNPNKEITNLLAPTHDALRYKNSNPDLIKSYKKYDADCYVYAWDQAMLKSTKPLVLPDGIPKALENVNIIKTHKKVLEMQNKSK